MIISKIIGKILPLILKEVFKAVMPELRPLQKYVNEPNELDKDMKKIKKRVSHLEVDHHPPVFSKEERDNIIKRLDKLELNTKPYYK